jgi:hypothetical protein
MQLQSRAKRVPTVALLRKAPHKPLNVYQSPRNDDLISRNLGRKYSFSAKLEGYLTEAQSRQSEETERGRQQRAPAHAGRGGGAVPGGSEDSHPMGSLRADHEHPYPRRTPQVPRVRSARAAARRQRTSDPGPPGRLANRFVRVSVHGTRNSTVDLACLSRSRAGQRRSWCRLNTLLAVHLTPRASRVPHAPPLPPGPNRDVAAPTRLQPVRCHNDLARPGLDADLSSSDRP